MSATLAPTPWTAHESCGGMVIRDAHDWAIANVIQRNAHPVHGGEITRAQCIAHAKLVIASPLLVEALAGLLNHYVALVQCGDSGNWYAEKETQVIAARAALRAAGVPA